MGNEETENKLSVKTLGAIAGIVFTILGSIAGAFVYIDEKYVHQDIYEVQIAQSSLDYSKLDEKTAQLFMAAQEANQSELNMLRKEIKDASALPLIVRRDVLLLRGDNISSEEAAELNIIRVKLEDLNIQ